MTSNPAKRRMNSSAGEDDPTEPVPLKWKQNKDKTTRDGYPQKPMPAPIQPNGSSMGLNGNNQLTDINQEGDPTRRKRFRGSDKSTSQAAQSPVLSLANSTEELRLSHADDLETIPEHPEDPHDEPEERAAMDFVAGPDFNQNVVDFVQPVQEPAENVNNDLQDELSPERERTLSISPAFRNGRSLSPYNGPVYSPQPPDAFDLEEEAARVIESAETETEWDYEEENDENDDGTEQTEELNPDGTKKKKPKRYFRCFPTKLLPEYKSPCYGNSPLTLSLSANYDYYSWRPSVVRNPDEPSTSAASEPHAEENTQAENEEQNNSEE